jgi:50S ribosomal subunit-associated GTPase HflX
MIDYKNRLDNAKVDFINNVMDISNKDIFLEIHRVKNMLRDVLENQQNIIEYINKKELKNEI